MGGRAEEQTRAKKQTCEQVDKGGHAGRTSGQVQTVRGQADERTRADKLMIGWGGLVAWTGGRGGG